MIVVLSSVKQLQQLAENLKGIELTTTSPYTNEPMELVAFTKDTYGVRSKLWRTPSGKIYWSKYNTIYRY